MAEKKKSKKRVFYSPEIGIRICDAIMDSHMGLSAICKANPDLPCHAIIRRWLLNHTYPEFSRAYQLAKEWQANNLFDKIIQEVDDLADFIDFNNGFEKGERENSHDIKNRVDAVRLKVESYKWCCARLLPSKYSDYNRVVKEEVGGKAEAQPSLAELDLSKLSRDQLEQLKTIVSVATGNPSGRSKA